MNPKPAPDLPTAPAPPTDPEPAAHRPPEVVLIGAPGLTYGGGAVYGSTPDTKGQDAP